ncbi:DUF3710 domain-containing protein [Pseudonocardia sp. GCM10023141]|uniref:DUF3710 domain-containing protein n=1 Tax=Pseudonocardia sp. GCM10023141 TaxID=3252653 RepID=UPI0036107CA6
MAARRQAALQVDPVLDDDTQAQEYLPGDDVSTGRGPYDVDDIDPEATDATGIVDFGAVRVAVPTRGTVALEPAEGGRMQAVHVSLPEGRLSVSALAAPKSSALWPELVKEIEVSLREGGARVRTFTGDWGRELHATTGAATSVFVGVDGPRWMLYGVATGPTRDAGPLDVELRRMLSATVVVRGKAPYPVRTVLPLTTPEHLAEAAANEAAAAAAAEVAEAAAAQAVAPPTRAQPAPPPPPPPARYAPSDDTAAVPTNVVAPRNGFGRPAGADADGETQELWPQLFPSGRNGRVRQVPGRVIPITPAPANAAVPEPLRPPVSPPVPAAPAPTPDRDDVDLEKADVGALWADPLQVIADVEDPSVFDLDVDPDNLAPAPPAAPPLPESPAVPEAELPTVPTPVVTTDSTPRAGRRRLRAEPVATQPWSFDPTPGRHLRAAPAPAAPPAPVAEPAVTGSGRHLAVGAAPGTPGTDTPAPGTPGTDTPAPETPGTFRPGRHAGAAALSSTGRRHLADPSVPAVALLSGTSPEPEEPAAAAPRRRRRAAADPEATRSARHLAVPPTPQAPPVEAPPVEAPVEVEPEPVSSRSGRHLVIEPTPVDPVGGDARTEPFPVLAPGRGRRHATPGTDTTSVFALAERLAVDTSRRSRRRAAEPDPTPAPVIEVRSDPEGAALPRRNRRRAEEHAVDTEIAAALPYSVSPSPLAAPRHAPPDPDVSQRRDPGLSGLALFGAEPEEDGGRFGRTSETMPAPAYTLSLGRHGTVAADHSTGDWPAVRPVREPEFVRERSHHRRAADSGPDGSESPVAALVREHAPPPRGRHYRPE